LSIQSARPITAARPRRILTAFPVGPAMAGACELLDYRALRTKVNEESENIAAHAAALGERST